MSFAQLVQLYFERSVALQNYWTLHVVVIGGLLAFSSLRQSTNRLTTVLVSVLFLCFAYKNCGAVVETTEQRSAVLEMAKASAQLAGARVQAGVAPDMERVGSYQLPPTPETTASGARTFHYSCDALTVLTLWSMEWRRRRREREAREHA